MNRKLLIGLGVIVALLLIAVIFYQVIVAPIGNSVLQNVYATGTAGGFSTP